MLCVWRRWASVGLLGVSVWLGGCASPGTKVILLPQADGSPSAVIVNSAGGQQTLSTPYQSADARTGTRGAPSLRQSNPAEVGRAYGPLFDQAPAKPATFVLFFNSGSLELTAESRITLFNAMDDALRRSGADIMIVGHTDTLGSDAYNDGLSEKRAQLVEAMLVARGFTTSRLRAVGRGEHQPAVVTRDGVNEPRNRRVEILVR